MRLSASKGVVLTLLGRGLLIFGLHLLGWLYVSQLIWPGGGPTLIWPSAAVAFAALLLYGIGYWPFVALACVVAEWMMPPGLSAQTLFAVGGPTLGAVAAVLVVRWLGWREQDGLSLRGLLQLFAGALTLAISSALLGGLGAWLIGLEALSDPLGRWLSWVVGDLFGIVVCMPALLRLHELARKRHIAPDGVAWSSGTERLLWLGVMLIGLALLFLVGADGVSPAQGLTVLPLALLAWSALRLEPVWTALAVAALGLATAALSGLGLAGFQTPHGFVESTRVALFIAVLAALPILLCAAEQERRRLLHRLAEQARRDDLTGLRNRAGFVHDCERLWNQAAQRAEEVALVHLDLDQFKLVNDACGAAGGDAFLAQLAGVLAAHARPDDVLGRMGGDEFAMFWRNTDAALAESRAEALLQLVESFRFPHQGRVLSLTASVGMVCTRLQEQSLAQLQREATTAAQTAKEQGGHRIKRVVGTDLEVAQRQQAMQWAVQLSEAIEQDRFRLYAQRIVPLQQAPERGLMLELLLRMQDGQGGLLLPGRFIASAERYGLAARLDRHVLHMALRWFSQRRDLLERVDRISINLSAASLGGDELLPYLQQLLRDSGFPPRKLCLEITETDAIRDLARTRTLMEGLRAEGVRFALDDFGSGFCSFGYLRTLPVDYIKIDGSFVRDLAEDPGDRAIVRAIVEVSKSLGKQTVAECVESEAARAMVAALEVDHAQGFALHRPEPMEALLDTRRLAARAAGA